MKRLAILAMYSKEGKVYSYLEYLIKELKKEVQAFYVVCNGILRIEEQEKIKPYIDDIFLRSNEGYDATAFKQTMEEYLGWKKVYEYDELILLNDSFFGPFISFADIFRNMSKRECDFWAFTSNQESNTSIGDVPFHYQSYFWAIREPMLKHKSFRKFWETLPKIETYKQAVSNYELRMTRYFNSEGFVGNTYVDDKCFSSEVFSERYIYTMFDPYALVVHKGCPVVKKKCFLLDRKQIHTMSEYEDIVLLMKYLKQNNNYDTDMIWEVLSDQNVFLKNDSPLCMDYIVHEKVGLDDYDKGNMEKSVIIIYINNEMFIDDVFAYIKNIDQYIDIIISYDKDISDKIESEKLISKRVQFIQDRENMMKYVDSYCKKFEYLCFINLQNIYEKGKPLKTGRSRLHILFENSICSIGFIADIMKHLSEEKLLSGMIVEDNMWNMNFNNTKSEQIGAIWIKNKYRITKNLWEIKTLADIHQEGMRYERMISPEYARIRMNLLRGMISRFSELTQINSEKELADAYRTERIMLFCQNKKDIYIFGNGIYGKECYQILCSRNIFATGFLVSGWNESDSSYLGVPVYKLEHIFKEKTDWSQTGVIVCITSGDANNIKKRLNSLGCDNVILFE